MWENLSIFLDWVGIVEMSAFHRWAWLLVLATQCNHIMSLVEAVSGWSAESACLGERRFGEAMASGF